MSMIIRPMAAQDLQKVWLWRNSDRVRNASFNSERISYEEHLIWWESYLKNPLTIQLIFEWNDLPVGVVSFKLDENKRHAVWSFYIGETLTSGLGSLMARQAIEYIFFHEEIRSITGYVLSLNDKSSVFHENMGFELVNTQTQSYERDGEFYDIKEYRLENWLYSSEYKLLCEENKVRIRPLRDTDIDEEYVSWYQNSDGHLDFFTGSRRSFSKDSIVDDIKRGLKVQRWFYYLILDEAGVKIGNFKVGLIDQFNFTSDLVCLVGNRQYAGRGLAAKSIKIANNIAFLNHGIRRLHGGMYEDHIASFKAYTRAGWYEEARMKGYYCVNGKPVDRICVACLNPKYFKGSQ